MFHNLPTPRRWLVFDTCANARALNIKAERKSLDALNDFFALDVDKTKVYTRQWHEIRSPHASAFEKARKHIVEHCEFDVKNNRDLFYELWPRVLQLNKNPFTTTKW